MRRVFPSSTRSSRSSSRNTQPQKGWWGAKASEAWRFARPRCEGMKRPEEGGVRARKLAEQSRVSKNNKPCRQTSPPPRPQYDQQRHHHHHCPNCREEEPNNFPNPENKQKNTGAFRRTRLDTLARPRRLPSIPSQTNRGKQAHAQIQFPAVPAGWLGSSHSESRSA